MAKRGTSPLKPLNIGRTIETCSNRTELVVHRNLSFEEYPLQNSLILEKMEKQLGQVFNIIMVPLSMLP